jgi:hypothetical protein
MMYHNVPGSYIIQFDINRRSEHKMPAGSFLPEARMTLARVMEIYRRCGYQIEQYPGDTVVMTKNGFSIVAWIAHFSTAERRLRNEEVQL